MANKKKDVFKPGPMTEGKRNIIQGLLQEYNIECFMQLRKELSYFVGKWCKEKGFELLSCEGKGWDDGYETHSWGRW